MSVSLFLHQTLPGVSGQGQATRHNISSVVAMYWPSSCAFPSGVVSDMARGHQKFQSQQKNAKKQADIKKSKSHDQKAAAKAALVYTCTICRVCIYFSLLIVFPCGAATKEKHCLLVVFFWHCIVFLELKNLSHDGMWAFFFFCFRHDWQDCLPHSFSVCLAGDPSIFTYLSKLPLYSAFLFLSVFWGRFRWLGKGWA